MKNSENKYGIFLIESLIIILIFIISAFLSYSILTRISFIPITQIVEKTNYISPNIYIDSELIDLKSIKKNIKHKENINKIYKNIEYKENIKDYYLLKYKDNKFLLSNDENSYNYGFITKKYINNILYLYSHNSYKQTENSGYYLYNNLGTNSIIEFNNNYKYKVIKTELIDINKGEEKNLKLPSNTQIIYFTCTPYGDNIRKVFYMKSVIE